MAVDNALALELLQQRLPESDSLDYKSDLPSSKEFAKDVAAFANSHGGWLFIGVNEDNRYPTTIPGIEPKVERTPVVDWIQDVITSRITPILKWKWYMLTQAELPELALDRIVVALHVPHSPAFPHVESESRRYFIRRDADSVPANEGEVRRMYFEAHSVPRLAMTPGYVSLLNWRPAVRIYNVGNAPALRIHGRLGFGPDVAEDTDLTGSPKSLSAMREVNIPVLLPGQFESVLAHDAGPNHQYAFWSAQKVLWSGTFMDHAEVEYRSRQLLNLLEWEQSIVLGPHMWPSVLSELQPKDLPALGLWSGHLAQYVKNYFKEDGSQLGLTSEE